MRRNELKGFWSIQPIENLESIAEHGILCHNEAARLPHVDISMASVQGNRRTKRVPNSALPPNQWRPLHDYANLYLCPRNPMLFKRLDQKDDLAVLRLDLEVLDIEGVVVTDGNAAANPTRFDAPDVGIERINRAVTFATWWTHADPYAKAEHRRRMCAEVLVPDRVPPEYINRVVVAGQLARDACQALPWPQRIDRHMFFG
jgi:hypothetical protein